MSIHDTRVLVADAEDSVRVRLFRALLDLEVFCDCAANGGEAIARLAERPYALVVLDFSLPHAGAAAVMEALRAIPAAQRPIVIGTACSSDGCDSENDLVQMILRRPLRVADLAAMVSACLALTAARHAPRRAAS